MPISAGITMVYNLGFVAACAVRRIPILIHHHSYSYINQNSRSMALLNRLLGEKDGQIFLSDSMRAGFDRQYHRRARAVVLPNSYAMALNNSIPSSATKESTAFRIGHFSNLSIEKGLQTVIEAFAQLHAKDSAFELHLGGPAMGPKEQLLLDKARSDFGDSVRIYGALYGADKDRFFKSINAFWFPSEYVNEAQPIVLIEALSYGVPCLSIKRGCIEWLLSDTGIVAQDKPDFIERAVEHARRNRESVDRTVEARRCIDRYATLRGIEAQGFSDAVAFLSGQ